MNTKTSEQDKLDAAKLLLQNAALRGYYDYNGEDWDDWTDARVSPGMPTGDPMVRFLWQEVGEAGGDVKEALRMMLTVQNEITAVCDELTDVMILGPEKYKQQRT